MLNTINNSVASQGPKGTAEDQIVVAYDIRGWRCACERPSPTISKVRSRLTVSVAGVPSTGRAHQGSSGQGRAARAKSWPLPGPNRQRLLGEAKCPRLLSPHSRLRPACFSLCRSRRVCVCVFGGIIASHSPC